MKKSLLLSVILSLTAYQLQAGNNKLTIPDNGWRINNFKNKTNGAELSFPKTPEDNPAVKADFFGKGPVNISLTPAQVKKQAEKWPEKFNGFKGDFWNNGKQNWLTLSFKQKGVRGKFTALVKMNHKGWKTLTINKLVNFQDKAHKIEFVPAKCSGFVFSIHPLGHEKTVVGFGPLTWRQSGVVQQKLPLGNSGRIVRIATPPKLDGILDDAAWKKATEFPLKNKLRGSSSSASPRNPAWVKAAFDNKNLYLAGKFYFPKGTNLNDDIKDFDTGLWAGEDVEFFVFPDIDNRQYYQLMVNPAGTRADIASIYDQVDDRIRMFFKDWNGKWNAKAKKYDNSWTVEAVVPWKTMNASKPPEIIQFQAQRIDRTGNGAEVAAWGKAKRKAVDTFGALSLGNKNAPPVKISDLSVLRSDKGTLAVSGKLTSPLPLGKINLKAMLSPPSAAPKTFDKTITANGKSADFTWNLNVGQCINGFHSLVILASPESSGISESCADFHFNQTIPPDIGFADVFLNPVPKKMTWGKGKFVPDNKTRISLAANATPRTEKTAKFLVDKLYGHFGVKPKITRNGNSRIRLSVDKKKVKKETGTNWHEAYLLDITPEGIEITGAGEAGLYYGVVTLGQIMDSSKLPNTPLKTVGIKDWPTYKKRVDHVLQQFHQKKSVNGSDGYQIPRLKNWIKNWVAGNKFNTLPFSWCDQVNYPSRPELHHPNNFTPEEISDLFAFAREHFIEVIPSIKMGGHCAGLLRHYPELAEKKFGKAQMDVTNPKSIKLMEDLYSDMLKMSGPETKYFHTDNNEWWHKSKYRTAEHFVHNGKNRQEIYRDFLLAQYDFLKKHNVRMIMMSDMMHPQHNGRPPWNLSEVAKQIPKDIIITSWGPSNDFFVKLGFKEVWYVGNGFTADYRKPCKGSEGFGTLKYLSIDSLFNHSNLERWLNYGYHTELQSANYAWNGEEKASLPMTEWTMRYMPNLMGTYSNQPDPMAGEKLAQVKFKSDSKLAKKIGLKNQDIVGGIKMALGSVEVVPGKPFKYNFSKPVKLSSLYILDAVMTRSAKDVKALQKRYRKPRAGQPYGLRIGQYILRYKDGTESKHDILLGRNICLFKNTVPASRYVKEGRCLYPLKSDQSTALLQTEWVNPHPEKPVKSFEIVTDNSNAPVILCGLTVRNTKK